MERQNYKTDLTDAQWEIISKYELDKRKGAGCPTKNELREIINGINYVVENIRDRHLLHSRKKCQTFWIPIGYQNSYFCKK